jgi:crotonobetainyl-CoA:carnitine CoA-transferase CaiB-like acyl-CoA transferase
MIMDLAAEDGRKVRVMGNPIKFAESASGAPLYPPAPGENSAAILSGILELTDAEISSLTDRKVIVAGKISK